MQSIYLTARCAAAHKGCVVVGNPDVFAVIFDLSIILQGRGTGVGAAWSSTVPAAVIQLLPPAVHFEQKEKKKRKMETRAKHENFIHFFKGFAQFSLFFAPYIPPPAARHCLCLAFKCLANKLAALFPFSCIFSHFHIPFFWFLARLHFRLLCQRGVWLMPATPLETRLINDIRN